MKQSFWSSNPFRIALAVLIVLGGAAAMVAATLQNLGVILAPTSPSSSSVASAPVSEFQKQQSLAQAYGNKLIGKTEAEASKLAKNSGFDVRTVARDEEKIAVTADLVSNRIDLWVRDNIVYKVTVG